MRPARQHARTVVRRWQLEALTDTVELLVSELVTNAVQASAGRADQRAGAAAPQIRFWLASDRRQVLVRISDPDGRLPVSQDPGPDAETGRGLLLVAALSAGWGYAPDGPRGKIVWALCAP